jgi:hypothetical protein
MAHNPLAPVLITRGGSYGPIYMEPMVSSGQFLGEKLKIEGY